MRIGRMGLVWGLFFVCSGLMAEDYQISLTRAAKVGDKFEVKYAGTMFRKMEMTSQGKILVSKGIDIKSQMEGVGEVLKIDDLKRPIQIL